jgi:hypothetical protein
VAGLENQAGSETMQWRPESRVNGSAQGSVENKLRQQRMWREAASEVVPFYRPERR